jgi:hypothetical protein
MLFNWVPDPIIFITDPERNAIVALTLGSDEHVFQLKEIRRFAPTELNAPVDLAPAIPEVASRVFSSNTTLAGGSDFYVLNRGNGTIVRMRQDGVVVAVRQVALPDGSLLGPASLNGIAVSPDAQRLWITISTALPGYLESPGAVLEVPAFGPGRAAGIDPGGLLPFRFGGPNGIGLAGRKAL